MCHPGAIFEPWPAILKSGKQFCRLFLALTATFEAPEGTFEVPVSSFEVQTSFLQAPACNFEAQACNLETEASILLAPAKKMQRFRAPRKCDGTTYGDRIDALVSL